MTLEAQIKNKKRHGKMWQVNLNCLEESFAEEIELKQKYIAALKGEEIQEHPTFKVPVVNKPKTKPMTAFKQTAMTVTSVPIVSSPKSVTRSFRMQASPTAGAFANKTQTTFIKKNGGAPGFESESQRSKQNLKNILEQNAQEV